MARKRIKKLGVSISMTFLAALAATFLVALIEPEPARGASSEVPVFEYALPVNAAELDDAELAKALDMAKAAGVNSVSSGAVWWYLNQDRSPRSYDWSSLDRLVAGAEERSMKVNLQLSGTPDWVHPGLKNSVPSFFNRIWHPPRGSRQLGHWSNFVYDVVSRYEGRVARYEMWNEPNLVEFWKPKPSPKEYAALLRISHRSAKKAYPQAKVVFAGLSRNDAGYLNAYYSAAKRYSDATRRRYYFDVLGVHPYSDDRSPDRVDAKAVIDTSSGIKDHNFLGITRMKRTMDARGDAGKRIFLGEYGFSTTDTWMKAVPDYRRALYLKRAYEQARRLPYVEGMSWYYYRPSSTDGAEWSITDSDWNPSLTYRALAQATGAEPTAVEVSLSAQQETISGIHEVVPAISGLSQESISRWELYADGALVGSHDQAPFDWDTRSVANGNYSLMVAAYTEEGSVWASEPVSVSVSNAAVSVSVASLSTDASSHAAGSLVEAEATLSATAPTAVDEIVFAVRLKGTDENHDFYPDKNYSIGTTLQTLTSEKVFSKPGTYVYWVAYYRDGSWHNLPPRKEFVVR